jgi:hypothetical protein
MTREKKGNLPSGVTAVPCVKSKGKIPFSPTQLAPLILLLPLLKHISLFLKRLFALLYFLCEKFPDIPGSSVLEPFEPFEPFLYGRQHVVDLLSPGMSRSIHSAFYLLTFSCLLHLLSILSLHHLPKCIVFLFLFPFPVLADLAQPSQVA